MKTTILKRLSHAIRCDDWDEVEQLEKLLPSGSGIDNGTTVCNSSRAQRIVLLVPFHHMDEHGYYDGWSEFKVILTPCLEWGFDLRITGRDRNMIKEYLADTYHYTIGREVRIERTENGNRIIDVEMERLRHGN